ncbi:MAG: hypothetical protein ABIU63_05680 [Chitinophagaceae bacterium]
MSITYPPKGRLHYTGIFFEHLLETIVMLSTLFTAARNVPGAINDFLKNEAEILTDFKTRIITSSRESDNLQSSVNITYNRIINKMNEAECMAFLSDRSLFMEENY